MKILHFDLECTPLLGYVWGMWEQNVTKLVRESYILTVAWKWADEKKVHSASLPDFKTFKKDIRDDKELVTLVHGLFDKADVVIAHNGKAFDIKKMNTAFMHHKLKPPSPYKVIDTKTIAKRVGYFPSNKLDSLGQSLSLGRKLDTGGFELWERCMAGDKKAFKRMEKYNRQDVVLLEKVYLEFRPWIDNHPHINPHVGSKACNTCGSTHTQRRGKERRIGGFKSKYQCFDCGHWFFGPLIKQK